MSRVLFRAGLPDFPLAFAVLPNRDVSVPLFVGNLLLNVHFANQL
jgi:hypothetical protein